MQDQDSKKVERKLAAIMFIDIVGYSRMMGHNENETFQLLEEYDSLVTPIIDGHNGAILKKLGDGMFCEFASAVNAVECSLEIQKELHHFNKNSDRNSALTVRIGIHVGDVIRKDDDLFGDGVNIAARIESLTPPGGICISESVHSAVSSHPQFRINELGPHSLKNISKPQNLYQVISGFERNEPDQEKSTPEKPAKPRKTDSAKVSVISKWSAKKISLIIAIPVLLVFAVIFSDEIADIFSAGAERPVSEKQSSDEILNDSDAEMLTEVNSLLASDQAQRIMTDISGISKTEELLQFLQKGQARGRFTFGRREDFFDPDKKYIVILDEQKVHSLLFFYKSLYYDTSSKKSYADLRQSFKGMRNIWIELL